MAIGNRVFLKRPMPSQELLDGFADLPAANIADTMGRSCAMNPRIRLMSGFQGIMVGPALTVKARAGDNLFLHQALDMAQPGDIIVLSNDEDQTRSLMGEIMFTYAKYQKKLGGLVLDGPIRDVDALREMDLPVYATGSTPGGPHKEGPGEINVPIACGGISVNPGDIIVAELKQQGKDIISLNVGEPDFGTPDYIKVAGMKAIADNFTKYTPGNGILELRQEIVKKLKQDNGIEYGLNEITTSVGAKQAIASAMMVIAGPGDEVILPIPCWVSYTEMIRLAGATPVFVPVRPDNYELDLKAIEDAITPRTKAIIICTPNNPTGAVYSEESLRKLAELAVKHDFFIVADEIYEKLVYDGAKHFSVASISQEVKERTVTVNGFSKAYAMTGWRIGYAAARPDVIKGIMAVQSQTTSATSSISQKAAAAALRGPQHDMEVMVEEFKRRKDYVVKRLNGIPGIVCPDVKGAFYVYPDVQAYLGKSFGDRRIETAVDLCQYLLDEALVSTVPGEAYNVPGKIRISYSNSMENLEKALDRVEKALEALH